MKRVHQSGPTARDTLRDCHQAAAAGLAALRSRRRGAEQKLEYIQRRIEAYAKRRTIVYEEVEQ